MIPFFKDPKTGKWITAHFHNVSANDTNEYSNIGVNQQLTWSSLIGSRFGFFALNPDISNATFETLGIGESLAPMIQSIDHDRAIKMAQQMRQSLPIINPHVPLVSSGAEFLIPQVTSSKFIIKAEDDGKVLDIKEGKYILVEYKDGTRKLYNLMPRISRTKRGLYLPLELIPEVKVGQKIKKGQPLASVSQLQKGVYRYGRNVCVAIMQYNGGGYEDGWVVTEDTLEKFEYYEYKEVIAIVPSDSVVKKFVYKPGTEVKRGEPLIVFEYKSSLDEYLDKTELLSDEFGDSDDDNVANITKNNFGEIVIKSPYDGVIHDVRIYINGKVDSVIENAWKEIVREQEKLIKTAEKVNNDKFTFADSIDTSMHKRGGHKWKSKEFQGALIMIFIKTKKKPTYGSKFVFRGGNKGTVTYIIPKDKKPIAKETGLKIDWIHNPLSIIGRKNSNFKLK
jgi:DNA-directed RNA polymerase subunit beta